ncbi:hypothetical protein EHI44_16790 [Rhizobium leguminosarum]|uniref:hypothetical protein n=1 Tax=Rhizobium leguminosarum TaxID=384 RepID=UPI000FF220C8|nr:hypothetical protein [Rhizobium leguminosarum]RWY85172.1 hypothetical protein EHI44_16790 [Rhizobium leguminosarum]
MTMPAMTLKLRCDATALNEILTDLDASLKSLPEISEFLIRLLDSGEELFRIDSDVLPAPLAGELLVRLHPSDALRSLVTASRAGDADLRIFEHATPPVELLDVNTTSELRQ